MLNLRTALLSVAVLALSALLAVGAAISLQATLGAAGPVEAPAHPARLSNVDATRLYRSELGSCVDVALGELAGCRWASRVLVPAYRLTGDECFDVGIGELAGCRRASQVGVPSFRPRGDECFDVPIAERANCP